MRASLIAGISFCLYPARTRSLVSIFPAQLLPVLRQLSPEAFLSGEVIAQRLGCSRATVNNAIRAAQAAGFTVHAVHGRGYRLAAPVSWLDAARLARYFSPRGITLRHFDQLASTNALMLEWALADAAQRAPHRSLVSTEWQSQGRGRRGRDWHAGLGGGLMFSFLWRSGRPAAQLSGLSLAVGVALVKALRAMGLAQAQVKWPNDIQVAGAKLAGVLIELAVDRQASDVLGPSSAVIGVGLNVAGGEVLSGQVGQAVTDLQAHLGLVDRNEVLFGLIAMLDADLARFERDGFAAFYDEWHAFHAHQNQPVCLQTAQGEVISGVARGVDAQGALLLETSVGMRGFHSGEVSLRARTP
jgi:BirA family biotin operon repressor/biotin-[acetyl-CoA-carboxylase] ligase